jgi:tyrosyl-tRNA synthetase
MPVWYRLLLGEDGPPADLSARDAKRALAKRLVARFHGEEAAERAEADFDRKFVEHAIPDDVPDAEFAAADGSVHLPAVIATVFGGSRSEARRLITQGAVRLDGDPVADLDVEPERLDGAVLQVGRRKFARLRRA